MQAAEGYPGSLGKLQMTGCIYVQVQPHNNQQWKQNSSRSV